MLLKPTLCIFETTIESEYIQRDLLLVCLRHPGVNFFLMYLRFLVLCAKLLNASYACYVTS